jgi:hypothetical protein
MCLHVMLMEGEKVVNCYWVLVTGYWVLSVVLPDFGFWVSALCITTIDE